MLSFTVVLLFANAPRALQTQSFATVAFPILVAQEPLVAAPSVEVPTINKFEVKPVLTLQTGPKLVFHLQGIPKSDVNMNLPTPHG